MLSPGYSYDKAPDQKHFLAALARGVCSAPSCPIANRAGIQPIQAVSSIPDGPSAPTHARRGECDVKRFRLAETVLPVARRYVDTFQQLLDTYRVAKQRHRIRQSQDAQTAWCTAATKLPPSITPSAACAGFGRQLRLSSPPNTIDSDASRC